VGGDDPVDNETLLVIDFMNLKIKSAQSFGCTRKVRVYVCVDRGKYSYMYKYLRLYCISKKMEKK
jgi:hypothetical protein